MKITTDRANFLKPLGHVQSVVERRNTIPILSNVILRTDENNLSLAATDMDIDILENIECYVNSPGSLTVTAHILYDIVRKLPEGSEITIEFENGIATLTSNKSKFSLPVLPVEDYPELANENFNTSFEIEVESLRRLIDSTRFAISLEETRYYLNGIFFHQLDHNLLAVATDGHRLARASMPLPNGAELLKGVIVPRKAINEIRKLIEDFDSDKVAKIFFSETRIKVELGKTAITSKLIDGNFPDYSKVIPEQNHNIMLIDNQKFSESVDRVSTIFADKSRSVTLNLSKNLLMLQANSPDTGSASDEIEVDYSGEELSIGFNSRYLLDLCSQIGQGETIIAFKDGSSPALVKTPNDKDILFVLMPMRV